MNIDDLNPYAFTNSSFKELRAMALKGITLTQLGESLGKSQEELNMISEQLAFLLRIVVIKCMAKLDIHDDDGTVKYLVMQPHGKVLYKNKNFSLTSSIKKEEEGDIILSISIKILRSDYTIEALVKHYDETAIITEEQIIDMNKLKDIL